MEHVIAGLNKVSHYYITTQQSFQCWDRLHLLWPLTPSLKGISRVIFVHLLMTGLEVLRGLRSEVDRSGSCTVVCKHNVISVMFCFFYPLSVGVKRRGHSLSESPATVCLNGSSQVSVSFLSCSYLLLDQWCNIFVMGPITHRHRLFSIIQTCFSLLRRSRFQKWYVCFAQPLNAENMN